MYYLNIVFFSNAKHFKPSTPIQTSGLIEKLETKRFRVEFESDCNPLVSVVA